MCWCRRRDSNSHSFRHYPLKIACLPIPPRRLRLNCPATPEIFVAKILIPRQSLDSSSKNPGYRGSSSIFTKLFRRDLGSALSTCCRHFSSGGCRRTSCRRRCTRGRNGLRRSRCRHRGIFQHAACADRTGIADVSQGQSRYKKHGGQCRRRARQEVGTTRCTKQTARRATTKRRTHVSTLAVLNQDQANHAQCGQHLDRKNDAGKDVHIKT